MSHGLSNSGKTTVIQKVLSKVLRVGTYHTLGIMEINLVKHWRTSHVASNSLSARVDTRVEHRQEGNLDEAASGSRHGESVLLGDTKLEVVEELGILEATVRIGGRGSA